MGHDIGETMNSKLGMDFVKDAVDYNKIACCIGKGGSLPKHLDNDGSNLRDTRKLTVILYLNPEWTEQNGGQLRVYEIGTDNFRDVEPRHKRVVFFWSDLIVHEVLPVYCNKQFRYTITLWMPTSSRKFVHKDKQLYWSILNTHFSEYIVH
mmetsp:Transcript_12660/g.17504  ORF Transcript_12660/g.17504 Transcript_12660/m.17504 type:complete len:151 (+) Transcript_12660:2-454(+)